MSVNKYINGKLLQMSGNADTRLTKDDINTILGYTPADSSVCEETFKKYVQLDGGDTADGITTFTSNDTSESSSWTDVDVMNSGEKHSSLFSKISTMFKNIRYLYKLLGTTDISTVGDGTVSGAISSLNSNKVFTKSATQKLGEITSLADADQFDGKTGIVYLSLAGNYCEILCICLLNTTLQFRQAIFANKLYIRSSYKDASTLSTLWTDWKELI